MTPQQVTANVSAQLAQHIGMLTMENTEMKVVADMAMQENARLQQEVAALKEEIANIMSPPEKAPKIKE